MWLEQRRTETERHDTDIRDINKIRSIKISLASPEMIRKWSFGEVKNPETIDYKTHKPKSDGLFCERIFGPTKDYECACGKYKGIKHKGITCDRCGVELTQSKSRRSRLGHIELEMPVAHIWFSKGVPSRLANLLDVSIKSLERVLYYEEYVLLDPGPTDLKVMDMVSESECQDLKDRYGDEFRVGMGAEAIREILERLDLDVLAVELKETVRTAKSKQKVKKAIKRLKVIEDFRSSGNRPEWMIMTVLPVIPPDLRPLVPLDGGRFATSDLNDLYRRVINRNNRLRRLKEVKAPEVIIRNEKRMLQEAVDALLDNGRRGRPVKGSNNRPLKSLSDMLKGKQGRFRQNLLGKRVDYSGRSVIVVGPELKLHQCGLPKKMALELFEPFIIRKLEELPDVNTIRSAKRKIEREDPEVYDVLEEVIKDHPVLLNRAPTLHRLGIQAFLPVLVEGKAIKLHPMTCTAFNADFDGDQMAVHVPLSREAQAEARLLMLASLNILTPSHGRPICSPTQDIVMGLYYLTKMVRRAEHVTRRFSNQEEAIIAHEHGIVTLHEEITVRIDGVPMRTTVGRILFNEALPEKMGFVNELQDKGALGKVMHKCYYDLGQAEAAELADNLKALGFHYAKISGLSIGLSDMLIPETKPRILDEARKQVTQIQKQFEDGVITNIERYNKVVDRWTQATMRVSDELMRELESDSDGLNPIFIMKDSGARGSKDQIRQLAGMRGLMNKPTKRMTGGIGEIIESPIESNLKEGLTVVEYFISTHGARKGLADTALKTAEAGYLTRRLVDVAQDVIITETDCGTLQGIEVHAIREGDRIIEPLYDRILGRVALDDITNPLSGEILVESGEEITEDVASKIDRCGIKSVMIRSVTACETKRGVCAKCYGRDLATGRMVEMGEAVGVIAAQSIGEPGTQLTLRTFHIGGATSRILEQASLRVGHAKAPGESGLRDGEVGRVKYINLEAVVNASGALVSLSRNAKPIVVRKSYSVPDQAKGSFKVNFRDMELLENSKGDSVVSNTSCRVELRDGRGRVVYDYPRVPVGAVVRVKDDEMLKPGALIADWESDAFPLLARVAGKVTFQDMEEGRAIQRGRSSRFEGGEVTVVQNAKDYSPSITIKVSKGEDRTQLLPFGAELAVQEGEKVMPGDVLAWLPTPLITEHDGKCRFIDIIDGKTLRKRLDEADNLQRIVVAGDGELQPRIALISRKGDTLREFLIPPGFELRVDDGEDVFAGHILARTDRIVQEHFENVDRVPAGALILKPNGADVHAGEVLTEWDPYYIPVICDVEGELRLAEVEEGVTMRRQRGEEGSFDIMIIMEHKEDKHPSVIVKGAHGSKVFALPSGAHIVVHDGQHIGRGEIIAKIPQESFKSRDVTGGLPRVEEILEARRPKPRDLAHIARIDGWVKMLRPDQIDEEVEKQMEDLGLRKKKGARWVFICDSDGKILDGDKVETGKHIIVDDGDWVHAGDKMTDGAIDPHDYLAIMGERRAAEYLLNEVQEVYRLSGISTNDKHLEVIIRQMLRKVTITDSGDTSFLVDDDVDRFLVKGENDRVMAAGGRPASFTPKLMGITKASLGTESFISAASFQETTRVLTQAAISGREDQLLGLKENVITGHLIPAGTGHAAHRQVKPKHEVLEVEEVPA